MHSKTGSTTKRGYFEGFFSALHTKSLPNRPFEQIWCEVRSFSGVNGGSASVGGLLGVVLVILVGLAGAAAVPVQGLTRTYPKVLPLKGAPVPPSH
ncbi:hypothetical protein FRC0082_02228 [Corynebacterium diphtheriae]|nr:hypothetical protein FRC0082_02228 [Corynebacterium diphtheriae]